MNRLELASAIDEAQTADLARRRMLLHGMLQVLDQPWVDAEMRSAIKALATRCGRTIVLPAAAALRLGETWLLLVGSDGGGRVVRICAEGSGLDAGARFAQEVERALNGLRVAAAAQDKHVPFEVLFRRFTIQGGEAGLTIEGRSLGLATCVAAISHLTDVPPRSHVAGAAAVSETGQLEPVEGIAAKLNGLRTQWPSVDTIVVSSRQTSVPEVPGMNVVRAEHVAEALPVFGLDFPRDARPTWDELEVRLAAFKREDLDPNPVERWRQLSVEAEAMSADFAQHDSRLSSEALLYAGLFASHAGEPDRAHAILAKFPAGTAPLQLRARERVITASAKIEFDVALALSIAQEAVSLCEQHDSTWLGRAIGTQGRVLLHAGRPAEAEPILRSAYASHEKDQAHGPRSAIYLAQCLRHLGRPREALDLADWALDVAVSNPRHRQGASTRLYALLERGRALLDLGLLEEAVVSLEQVTHQGQIASYPSLGARRSLVKAYRALGQRESARTQLQICTDVALDDSGPETLRKVGAVAAAEDLKNDTPLLPVEQLEAAWTACFREATSNDVLQRWIY